MRLSFKHIVLSLSALALTTGSLPLLAKDYLLTGLKPNHLALVDAKARTVEKIYEIPDAAPGPLTITPSPDGQRAYVIVNRWESVSGIDLNTGKEVFRADFSQGDTRIKGMFGMDISPDGKELAVFQSPVKLGLGEYEVQDTYIAIYDPEAGIGAKPVRTLKAPRRTAILAYSNDGSKLYAIGWDITALDPKTGDVLGVHKVRTWERPGYGSPDVLDVWPQWEQADMFSTPYFAVRTDVDPGDPTAYKTGLLRLDLETDQFEYKDFEDTSVVIFSSVVNPVRRNEMYLVYTQLTKVDFDKPAIDQRINLDHTYYSVNVSSDGSEVYVGGTMNDIAVYSTDTLERLGTIEFESGADQALASLRVIQRD